MASTPSWDGKGIPKNLKALVEFRGSHEEFRLSPIYFLQLDHSLMGCFPAILKKNKKIVFTDNPEALVKVSEVLSPRRSKITRNLAYISHKLAVAYIILGESDDDLERSEPQELASLERIRVLTEEDKRTKKPKEPFEWAPGLVSDDMTREEFLRTLKVAAEQFAPA